MLAFGRSFAENLPRGVALELVGDVGTGKTTFVRGLAEGLGAREAVTSPSFTISKSYALEGGGRLVHYDFYRLSDPGLIAEDLAENLESPENIVVVEWGASVQDILPRGHQRLFFTYQDDGSREVSTDTVKDSGKDVPAQAPEKS